MKPWEILGAIFALAICIGLYMGSQRAVAQQVAELDAMPITVVIDAGHGGMDGGAVSVSGTKESEINLEISQKTEFLLALCGFQTKMIRDSDISIHEDSAQTISEQKVSDLHQRVEIANNTTNGVLLSIHQNTFPEAQYHGAQVFYCDDSDSKSWAEWTQSSLIQQVDSDNNRQAKVASKVYLMEHITCPGILVECGFLSNETEEYNLKQPDYQIKLALAMVEGLSLWQQEGQRQNEV